MKRIAKWIVGLIFVAIDIFSIYILFRIALILRYYLACFMDLLPIKPDVVDPVLRLSIVVLVGMFAMQNLYPGYGLTNVKELERVGKSVSASFVLLAMISYFVKPFQDFPRSIFPIAWGLLFFSLPVARFFVRRILSRSENWYGIPVIVFGYKEVAEGESKLLDKIRQLGWLPSAFISLDGITAKANYPTDSVAILITPWNDNAINHVRILNQKFSKVVLLQNASSIGSLWVETRDLGSHLGLEFHYHLLSKGNRRIKRVMDFTGALLLLIGLSPLLVILAVLIKLDSKGPVLYQQKRLGEGFQIFGVYKFRTMVLNAEEKLADLLKKNPKAKDEYEEYHKLKNDPRITDIGRFLRKFSLDELPQLWNVLRGQMSLAGPRAYMHAELDDIGDYAATILRVKPGITGWWQVFGRHNTTFVERLEMDEYYISNWSLWMDIYIFIKTVRVVLFGEGA